MKEIVSDLKSLKKALEYYGLVQSSDESKVAVVFTSDESGHIMFNNEGDKVDNDQTSVIDTILANPKYPKGYDGLQLSTEMMEWSDIEEYHEIKNLVDEFIYQYKKDLAQSKTT